MLRVNSDASSRPEEDYPFASITSSIDRTHTKNTMQ
jgi:hypothetical protein